MAPSAAAPTRAQRHPTGVPPHDVLPVDVLALDVLILASGNVLATRATVQSALRFARRVVVADRSGTSRPAGCDGVEWLNADWQDESQGDALAAAGDRPILVLAAGEDADVVDAVQLSCVLGRARPGWHAEVAVGDGSEVRLVWPGPGAAARIGQPGPASVRSLRINPFGNPPDWLPAPSCSASERPLRFVVAAPGYSERSGGIVALHRLCDRLNAVGCEARIGIIDGDEVTNPAWRTPVVRTRDEIEGDVVIYPEIVSGNPLGAERVVRWQLNRPGRLNHGRAMDEGPDDLLVVFESAIGPGPTLHLPIIDPRLFFPKERPGRGGVLWRGKGALPAGFDCSELIVITRTWPAERRALAALLRSVDVLYTCDWLSAIALEATLCATPVVVMGEQEWTRDEMLHSHYTAGVACDGIAGLPEARRRVVDAYPAYMDELAGVNDHVEDFVRLVVRHFGDRHLL